MGNRRSHPESFVYLFILRLAFLLMISFVFLLSPDLGFGWRKGFVVASIVIFSINHMLYFKKLKMKWLLAVLFLDTAIASAYPFVFFGSLYPHELLLGVVGLVLFLLIRDRRIHAIWWGYIGIYAFGLAWLLYEVTGKLHVENAVINSTFIVFASLVGGLIRFYQDARMEATELYEKLEHSNALLQEFAAKSQEHAAARERIRIAREIHDTVGHKMTSLLVQLQVGRKLSEKDKERSRQTYLLCEDLARESLQEIRFSVRAMRGESMSGSLSEALTKLLEEFSEVTSMKTDISFVGEVNNLADGLAFTIYRVVQESLTNSQKHGNATAIEVSLIRESGTVRLLIADDGKGSGDLTEGFGLNSMRERVAEQGGRIEFSTGVQNGFTTYIELPINRGLE